MIIVANWREKTATSLSLTRSEKPGIFRSLLSVVAALLLDLDGHVAHRAQLADDELRVLGLELALDELAGLVADLVRERLGHGRSAVQQAAEVVFVGAALERHVERDACRPRTSCASDMSIVTMPYFPPAWSIE